MLTERKEIHLHKRPAFGKTESDFWRRREEMAWAKSTKQTTQPAYTYKKGLLLLAERAHSHHGTNIVILRFRPNTDWRRECVLFLPRTLREKEDVANQPRGEIGLCWMK
jgi:hypothetical protein